MWTYSGLFIENRWKKLFVYAINKLELEMFADENGVLLPEYHKEIEGLIKEEGLYQCLIGYGSGQDPTIYDVKYVSPITWEMNKKTAYDYEILALSRMTGEQISNELTDEEKKQYYKLCYEGLDEG